MKWNLGSPTHESCEINWSEMFGSLIPIIVFIINKGEGQGREGVTIKLWWPQKPMKDQNKHSKTHWSVTRRWVSMYRISLGWLVYFQLNKKGRKPRVKSVTLQLWWVENPIKLLDEYPSCADLAEHRGRKTREGAKSGVERLERIKRGSGIKGQDDKSRGIEILMTEVFDKINPNDHFKLVKKTVWRKRNWPDSSGSSLDRSDSSRWACKKKKTTKVIVDTTWSVDCDRHESNWVWSIEVQLTIVNYLRPSNRL